MIRDPSDGTVKEISPEANKINAVTPKTLSEEISGLPAGSQRKASLERLERSRKWLKDYQEKQNARGRSSEQERSTHGDSGNDQGTAKPGIRPDR